MRRRTQHQRIMEFLDRLDRERTGPANKEAIMNAQSTVLAFYERFRRDWAKRASRDIAVPLAPTGESFCG